MKAPAERFSGELQLNHDEQAKFAAHLIDSVKYRIVQTILAEVRRTPEAWDGDELRQYIADKFAEQKHPMKRERMKEYRNVCVARDL